MNSLAGRGINWALGRFPGRRQLGRAFGKFGMQQQREEMTDRLVRQSGSVVQSGPFTGMEIPAEACWGDGDRLAKLLGCYEAELHPWLNSIVKQPYDMAIDIGCAEGYYVAGLARALPESARIFGFDISREAQRICRLTCECNGVAGRVTIGGRCSPGSLSALLAQARRPFLLVDCEGAEVELLCDNRDPQLAGADILVECHDFIDSSITEKLYRRFSSTHRIEMVKQQSRNLYQFPFLQKFGEFERALAVCEFRPALMHWLFCASERGPE